jgi:DNA primase
MTMVNHPPLLDAHLDRFANLELAPDLDALRGAILALMADGQAEGEGDLRPALCRRGFQPLMDRLQAQIEADGVWQAGKGASDQDAEAGWLQALTLHLRAGALHRELKAAEAALAEDPSDASFARLNDIRSELAKSEGMEALIEGFGASSGRQARLY